MGQAAKRRRRREAGTVIKGPVSYEVLLFTLCDILAGGLTEMLRNKPSDRGLLIIKTTAHLADRMRDRRQSRMLCMSCDHAFAVDEPPTEVAIALSWANPNHPPIISPVCAECAAADDETKLARMKAMWSKALPGGRVAEVSKWAQ
jgi:hypothetical protein